MTLVLTELSPFGIAMAADSAVTVTVQKSGYSYVQAQGAKKLQIIPTLQAGVSCWGMGSIGDKPTDHWLADFIRANSGLSDLGSFAKALATTLQSTIGPSPGKQARLGFHVAGFELYGGKPVPSFYHVHDGPSTTLQTREIGVDPSRFNANHDIPPAEFLKLVAGESSWMTRNGDYHLYAQLFALLGAFFQGVGQLGIKIPNSQNLNERAEYLVFQIRTISDLYRMSNLVPGIGGPISYLTISPAGIQSEGVSYH